MKNIIFLVLISFFSLMSFAQPPQQRPLPNQFRDYVDFRQSQERPIIEHKNGNVIITMSEEAFRRMQIMRMNQRRQRFHSERLPMNHNCEICHPMNKKVLPNSREWVPRNQGK